MPKFRRRSPIVEASPYVPGMEDGWCLWHDRRVLFFHLDRERVLAWQVAHSPTSGDIIPAVNGRGWEGEVQPIPTNAWIIEHGDGHREPVSADVFERLYERVE
jgi:hypothetical protein